LSLTSVGFLTAEQAAFLGVVPSAGLLRIQRLAANVIAPVVGGCLPYYLPDARMPRCTLATGVTNAAALIGALGEGTLPTAAAVETAGLIEVQAAGWCSRLAVADAARAHRASPVANCGPSGSRLGDLGLPARLEQLF
jgi:hypothetical protein